MGDMKPGSSFCVLLTIGSVAAATIARALIHYTFNQQLPYTPFVPAIMLTALFCGEWWGMLAIALSMVAASFWLFAAGESVVSETNDLIAMGLFAVAASLIVWLSAKVRRHRYTLERAAEERERLLMSEQAARREAEQANRAKDNFFASVTHELRNPLSSIVGWVQLLRMGSLNQDECKIAIESIERSAKVQGQLVDDLLDLSRIRSGKLRLSVESLCFTEIVDSAVQSMLPAALAKGIEVNYTLAHAVGPILGDATRLQQVVWNLLTNALKFTPTGGSVRIQLLDRDESAELVVSDSGEGIDQEFLPRIFGRFQQSESGVHRGGLGLGLAIVKEIVELHGGTIRATSGGKGKGSTFRIELPKLCVPAIAEFNSSKADKTPLSGSALAGKRVLIVDDDDAALSVIGQLLRKHSAETITAHSAAEAREVLVRDRINVIVSDIGMPEIDGIAFIRQLRGEHTREKIKAIALTGYTRDEQRAAALASGFDRFLSKPTEPEELVSAIAELSI